MNSPLFRRLAALVSVLFVLAAVTASTPVAIPVLNRAIYVSPTGDNKNNGLSPEHPFLTAQAAANISEPGDVIFFAEGEYSHEKTGALLTIRRSGEPGKPITYTPAPGAKVVFRSKGSWDMIKVTGARHIVIRGFRVIGSAGDVTPEEAQREMSNLKNPRTCGNGIGITSDDEKNPSAYVTVSDCEVSDFPGGGIFTSHSDYITFEHNVVHHCAYWSPYGNSGISVYQPTDVDDFTGYKIIVRDNVSYGNYQNIPFFFSNRKDPAKRHVTDGNGIIIDDFLNTQDWGHGSGKPYQGRALVANNVVFGNGGSGIHSYKSCNVDIVHNYAADNNRHPDLKGGQIFANATKNARIVNNILVAPAGKPVNSTEKNENLVLDHNLYANLDGSTPEFAGDKAGNLIAAPGLEVAGWDQGRRDFTAAPDSPLRGAGLPLADVIPDFFGKTRNAEKPDIGPFVLGAR